MGVLSAFVMSLDWIRWRVLFDKVTAVDFLKTSSVKAKKYLSQIIRLS